MHRWEQLLAHSHWVTISVFGRQLHVCARCSGIVLGLLVFKISLLFLNFHNYSLPFLLGFPISLLLALPSMIDWITQKLGFRQSTNDVRLTAGFLEGLGVASLNLLNITPFSRLLIVAILGFAVVSFGLLGRTVVHYWKIAS